MATRFCATVALLGVFPFAYAIAVVTTIPPSLNLRSYDEIGKSLFRDGYYRGFVDAIVDCCHVPGGFIMLDSPSGSGKSQAGVALGQLDYLKEGNLASGLELKNLRFRVFHLVWDEAVPAQGIYDEICSRNALANIFNNNFFSHSRLFALAHATRNFVPSDTNLIWEELLQPIFVPQLSARTFDVAEFRQTHKLDNAKIVLFVDEFPSTPKDVQTMLIVREALRWVPDVVLILAGTSAKASNAVSLAKGYSTSLQLIHRPWCLLLTRLPTFQLESSRFMQRRWKKCLDGSDDSAWKAIISLISISMEKGGNPRLITFAIDAAMSVLALPPASRWMEWQVAFSNKVTMSKFAVVDSWHELNGGMISQLNLLLEGSTQSELSNVMLGKHFGFRAIPDDGRSTGSGKDVTLADCGGWLYIGTREERIYGRHLQFLPGPYSRVVKGEHNYQTTMFASFERDPLMYLGCCRQGGYFSVVDSGGLFLLKLKAHEVVLNLWGKNSAGSINYQNPYALCNSGSLLEVMTVVASCNAAAISQQPSLPVSVYFGNLMSELGLPVTASTVAEILSKDCVLSAMWLPRCIFPGSKCPATLLGLIAAVSRVPNLDEYDIKISGVTWTWDDLLDYLKCQELAGEAKDQRKFGTKKLAKALFKLSRKSTVGFIVVRGCNQYWASSGEMKERLRKILLKGQKKKERTTKKKIVLECTIGKIFFFSSSGESTELDMENGKNGRIILIQVPASVLDVRRRNVGAQDVCAEPMEDDDATLTDSGILS